MQGIPSVNATAKKQAPKPPSSFELAILHGLQGKPVYQGTTPDDVTARRRNRNRAARKSRRINRKGR